MNPILAGLNVLLAWALVQRLYDRRIARLTALLLAASPWHLLMGMNFMSHTFSLTCTLGAAYAVARMVKHGRARWGFLGGLGIGLVSLVRPLEGVVVAVVLGAASLRIRGGQTRLAPVITLVLAAVAVGALVLPYNQALTGDPLRFPVLSYMDDYWGPGRNSLGFGPEKDIDFGGLDPFPGHGLADVIVNTQLNLTAINIELLGWGPGSLLLVLGLLAIGSLRGADRWMLGMVVAVVTAHSFYWFSGGPDFGARYWYLAIVPLAALSARAIHGLEPRLRSVSGSPSGLMAGALALSLAALVTFLPWRALDKYPNYRGMEPGMRSLIEDYAIGSDLVLVRARSSREYSSALAYSSLDPASAGPLIFHDRDSAARALLRRAYPARRIWLVDGPTASGGGFVVTAGPFPPGAPLPSAGSE